MEHGIRESKIGGIGHMTRLRFDERWTSANLELAVDLLRCWLAGSAQSNSGNGGGLQLLFGILTGLI